MEVEGRQNGFSTYAENSRGKMMLIWKLISTLVLMGETRAIYMMKVDFAFATNVQSQQPALEL